MHASSHEMMGEFVDVHVGRHRGTPLEVVDFGAQMIGVEQASYRTHFDDPAWIYRGLDIVEGRNVDLVLADPYRWEELPSESVDLFISGQAFEHIEHFWVTIFEVVRVLKPGGLTAIIAPSSGYEHRFPVDCWRFYPDGLDALGRFAQCEVVDSFADWGNDEWGDAILVIRKPSWSDDDRARFDRRAGLQRMMLSEQPITAARIADEWQYQPHSGTALLSPLADAEAGALTKQLTIRRDRRIATEIAAADAADQQRQRNAQALEQQLATLTEENTTLQRSLTEARDAAAQSPLTQVFGAVRAKIAATVGDDGRALYKKLRGRP